METMVHEVRGGRRLPLLLQLTEPVVCVTNPTADFVAEEREAALQYDPVTQIREIPDIRAGGTPTQCSGICCCATYFWPFDVSCFDTINDD